MKKNTNIAPTIETSMFNGNKFTYRHLDKVIAKLPQNSYINKNSAEKKEATVKTTATFIQSLTRYDSTYLLYSYMADTVEYAFLWETPYDETHRSYSRMAATWYDQLEPGMKFPVYYNQSDPRQHCVVDKKIKFDNAMFIGKKIKTPPPGKRHNLFDSVKPLTSYTFFVILMTQAQNASIFLRP